MAEEARLQCPSCGKEVGLGEIECPHFGVNLKSGEAYETRVKQAKGKQEHPEHFGGRVGAAVVVALGLIFFAGFMYERASRKVLADVPEFFRPPVETLQKVDDMLARADQQQAMGESAAAGKTFADARHELEGLVEWLQKTDESIRSDAAYAQDTNPHPWRQQKEYNRGVAKRQLKNLRAKVELRFKRIPAA